METSEVTKIRKKAQLEIARAVEIELQKLQEELDDTVMVEHVSLDTFVTNEFGGKQELHICGCDVEINIK